MTDYTKICWYCGGDKVQAVKTYYQCQDCGATHTVTLKPGLPELERHRRLANCEDGGFSGLQYSPTDATLNRIAKHRKKAAAE